MTEFRPEVVRLFAEEVRSLHRCNQKLSRLFLLAVICGESTAKFSE
jgi:hypothetical protein